MSPAGRLAGERVILTGGAGGAGAAAARLFAAEGARLCIFDVDVEAGRALVDELVSVGHEARFHHVDVSDGIQVGEAVAHALQWLGGVDVLFNHAGTVIVRRLIDTSEEEWDRLMDVNVKSMFLTCRAVLPKMMQQGRGVILNTSSISGLTASPLESVYCTSKGAILQLTRAIAVEYRGYGIRCNAICPGFIRTPHGLREMDELTHAGEPVGEAEIRAAQGRLCEPEEVARAALSLVSADMAFVSGAHLVVDNAWQAAT
ncbi:MAG: putative short-chain dehydrogenase/reductase [Actinomycetia bacterium]|nr:putative short-chain dehydrogenase/reductase [Actinomycetes bacterium]